MDLLRGIYETHIQVSDLETAMEFYGGTLGLELGTIAEQRRIAFYFVSDPDGTRSMLGLWEASDISPDHFAFRAAEDDIDRMQSFLADREIEPVEALGISPVEQPLVHPWMPAAAIYFEDPDGNQVELIADLSAEPRRDLDTMPLAEWRRL